METILEKLSSYNILNYLLPGILFAVFAELVTGYSFIHDDILVALFLFYFIGMVVSRVGSLIFEPLAKRFGIINFVEYQSFLKAKKKDPQIDILSEANNVYRSLFSVFVLVPSLKLYELLGEMVSFFANQAVYILFVALAVMFLFSYKKQTKYISSRVVQALKDL